MELGHKLSHTDYTFSMETLGTSWAEQYMGPSTAWKERGLEGEGIEIKNLLGLYGLLAGGGRSTYQCIRRLQNS